MVAEVPQEDLEPGTTVDIVGEGGEVVVTFEQRAIDAAWEQVYRDADARAAEQPAASTVVASLDGDRAGSVSRSRRCCRRVSTQPTRWWGRTASC